MLRGMFAESDDSSLSESDPDDEFSSKSAPSHCPSIDDPSSSSPHPSSTSHPPQPLPTVESICGVKIMTEKEKGIASQLWPSAEILANYITKNVLCMDDSTPSAPHHTPQSKVEEIHDPAADSILTQIKSSLPSLKILELGAGVGLTGLKLSLASPTSSVTLTDLPLASHLLNVNVHLNNLNNCSVSNLSWGTDDADNFVNNKFNLIVAADCVYWEELHQPLKKTLLTLLKGNDSSTCLICGVRRWKSDNAFYKSLNDVKDEEGRLECVRVWERKEVTVKKEDKGELFFEEGAEERKVTRIFAVRCIRKNSSTKNSENANSNSEKLMLLSDLGGTNARFELRRGASIVHKNAFPTVEPNTKTGSFEALVLRFLDEVPKTQKPDIAVMGVCGPVIDGAAYCASQVMMESTGPWRFTEASVSAAAYNARTILMNDFVAVGHALENIPEDNLHCLLEGSGSRNGTETIACLGPGTGLGNVFLVFDEGQGRRIVHASEGCMSSFVPKTQLQWDFLQWIKQTEGPHVPVDRIVSGQGIASWYEFLREREGGKVNAKVDEEFRGGDQRAAVVSKYGGGIDKEGEEDELCVKAIDCFLDTLGQEAANLGMRFLARGGVYIAGGGISAKMIDRIKDGRVLRAYLDQGVSSEIVEAIPLFVSDATDLGMKGVLHAAEVNIK